MKSEVASNFGASAIAGAAMVSSESAMTSQQVKESAERFQPEG